MTQTTPLSPHKPQPNHASNSKFNWRIFGPGLLMASAAIGGSHLISSTQAGAIYGWQLAIMVILANFFKYPFFRFATDYVYESGESLIAGYAKKSTAYLWIYFIFSLASSVITIGAVAFLAAVILGFMFPASLALSNTVLAIIVMAVTWVFLAIGRYNLLDNVTKVIMIALTLCTILAVIIAAGKPAVIAPDFITVTPWNMATLGFIVALMGWMPAPLEFAAINSMWISAKVKADKTTLSQGLLDFNVGYISTAILALFFMALGVFVQYGTGEEILTKGTAYVGQLINMYTQTIGNWSKILVVFVAFMTMFGTTITCADGYGRANAEAWRLIKGDSEINSRQVLFWTSYGIIGGLIIISFYITELGALLKFAMIYGFVSTPIFALLNYNLVNGTKKLSFIMTTWAILGLLFLAGFALLFLAQFTGLLDSLMGS